MGELYTVTTRWDTVLLYVGRQIQSERLLVDGQYEVHVHHLLKSYNGSDHLFFQDITGLPPPRKRIHHMMSGFEVLNSAAMQVPPQNTYHP